MDCNLYWRCAKNFTGVTWEQVDGTQTKSVYAFLQSLTDPRTRTCKYLLWEILACFVIGIMHGKDSGYRIVHWCRENIGLLREYGLILENGVASYDTHMRILRLIDINMFAQEFLNWSNEFLILSGVHIAIDGKGLRGGTDKVRGGFTPYMLNVVEVTTGHIIASFPILTKEAEVSVIPSVIQMIATESNLITIDAVGTCINIISELLLNNAHLFLLVKKNNSQAYESLKNYFEDKKAMECDATASKEASHCYQSAENGNMKRKTAPLETNETVQPDNKKAGCSVLEELIESSEGKAEHTSTGWTCEKAGGHVQYRKYQAITNLESESIYNWDVGASLLGVTSALGEISGFFRTIGWAESVRVPIEKNEAGEDITRSRIDYLLYGSNRNPHPPVASDSERSSYQQIGFISTLELTANEAMRIKIEHWGVETSNQILDITLREDEARTKTGKFSFSLLRKCAFNLLRYASRNYLADDKQCQHSTRCIIDSVSGNKDLMKKLLSSGLEVYRPVTHAA